MPTIPTALAIEGLLQYNNREVLAKKILPPKSCEVPGEVPASEVARRSQAERILYSPALYATPKPGPIPDVSSILASPKIYVVNHKRRDGGFRAASTSKLEIDVLNGGDAIPLSEVLGKGKEEEKEEGKKFVGWAGDFEEVSDDLLDPRDSVNVGTSGSDIEDGYSLRLCRLENPLSVKSRSQDEYYDTAEEFFSDGSLSNSSPSLKRSIEKELHLLQLRLIEESSKRKVAEEKLLHLNKQYEKLLQCLSHSRSSLPESLSHVNLKNDIDSAEICQEFVFLKSVSEGLEIELVKDELEEAFTKIFDTKNHEISRLRDRMKYYEAMNREMSQRNLEAVDLARKRRLMRRRMQKWVWGCVGFTVTAGVSLLAYSYLPHNGSDISSASGPDAATAVDITD